MFFMVVELFPMAGVSKLSVAGAIALFGPQSPVALATTVGVLVEVPVMFMLEYKTSTFTLYK